MDQSKYFEESESVVDYWLVDSSDKKCVIEFLIEALDRGISENRIRGLGIMWDCSKLDMENFVKTNYSNTILVNKAEKYISKIFGSLQNTR
jgi:hypothetical protein